jgi:HlyD family secretion protein
MPKPKKRRKVVVFSIIGIALALLTAGALVRKHEVVVTVQAEKVTRRNLTEVISYNGKIQPVTQVKISPEVSGEIIELPVKEGQRVTKGDLVLKIKPDFYLAARNQAEAAYKSSLASKATAEANLRKVQAEFNRNQELFTNKLISTSAFEEIKAAYDVANAQLTSAEHQVEMSSASRASSEESLAKTTIYSPITGTISQLNSEVGERVVGTATMAGTEVMTIADLNQMEARVDIGEMDVVLVAPGQRAHLEVDAFRDQKFQGTVTEIANSAKGSGALGSSSSSLSQEATKFEVRIRVNDKAAFRPGMSVTAEIETRLRTNVLTVPIGSVTSRVPKPKDTKIAVAARGTNSLTASAQASSASTNTASTFVASGQETNAGPGEKKSKEANKPIEAVFVVEGDHAKMVPVKLGILDDTYYEITDGLQEGQEVVSGSLYAISHDLEDGKKVKKGGPEVTRAAR